MKALLSSFKVSKILLHDYHYFNNTRTGITRDGSEFLPWFTYPAIEILKGWDLNRKTVLEFGSGYSTLFWANRAKSVLSIEHNQEWHSRISPLVPPHVNLELRSLDNYAKVEGDFDIIVIDGYARERMRHRCAKASLPHLKKGGFIIVDNSDWLPATCLYLRRQRLIQVDFSGFVPGNRHAQTTSFFLTRDFQVSHLGLKPVGGTGYNWETNLERELLAEMSEGQS